jgi:hypothetical protein
MNAAGDIEQQAMRGIQRHQRREAVAPTGDGVQRENIGGFIGIEYAQLRTDGTGIGERQADLKTKGCCRVVERKNLQRIVLLGDDNAGIIASRRGAALPKLALDAVDGQARQPQAEDTPPVY